MDHLSDHAVMHGIKDPDLSKHVGTTLLIAGWGCSNAHAMENVRMLAIGTGEMSSRSCRGMI